ncbi:hypothetical protein ACTFO8_08330 [Bacillus cereus group sp. MYBK65-1]|uniref:Uncharacterized protein n=1 Tax=Bacillus cereus TaxID=1396 RepID=A0A9X7B568_BACCE|nr:hypothetical protein [Bacillus cereus]EKS8379668.1 hypothetical protein [Bacillus cereus]EKS8385375.1 hypothetical protein [Bacillus cereus]MDA2464258.1 hypothetical protein [Bacillus cereus]PED43138.1 hypothetical protein CON26_16010 [Bacillus cereus]PFU99475.1 hypothetical protein COK98_32200 [Bacillus cereus]
MKFLLNVVKIFCFLIGNAFLIGIVGVGIYMDFIQEFSFSFSRINSNITVSTTYFFPRVVLFGSACESS